jgi:branched-chain amino acid transport system ATP-binding protein
MRRRGSELSGGQQQMMVIGRGLAPGPRLLLLDEPSQGLAPVIVKTVARVLAQLRGEDLSIVLVEQNLSFALSIADRVVVMENGCVVDRLSIDESRQNPDRIEQYLAIH